MISFLSLPDPLPFTLTGALERRLADISFQRNRNDEDDLAQSMERITIEPADESPAVEPADESPAVEPTFFEPVTTRSRAAAAAAAVAFSTPLREPHIEDFYQGSCPVCFNNFDEEDHKPDCGENCVHLMCQLCMTDAIEVYRQNNCPICRLSLFSDSIRRSTRQSSGRGRGRPRLTPVCG